MKDDLLELNALFLLKTWTYLRICCLFKKILKYGTEVLSLSLLQRFCLLGTCLTLELFMCVSLSSSQGLDEGLSQILRV